MSRSAAAYQKFTEDEIRQANSVDILSLARGYGYEPDALSVAGGGHIARPHSVELPCQFLFRLTLVYSGHGSAMDYDIGAVRPARGVKSGGIGNIRFREIRRNHFEFTKFRAKGASQHPLAAGQKNFHSLFPAGARNPLSPLRRLLNMFLILSVSRDSDGVRGPASVLRFQLVSQLRKERSGFVLGGQFWGGNRPRHT